ncbi:MAG: sigma-54 interaction domain-containing protein [Clostridium sp.]|uniref:sigma-54 interaction domain-containing protein n=1 Tax=Clostridium sp. TaxID=1506 RepID=UPI003F31A55C
MNTFTNFEYYRLVMDSLDKGVIFISTDFKIKFANTLAIELLNCTNKSLFDNSIFDLFNHLEETLKNFPKTKGNLKNFILSLKNKELSSTLKPLFSEDTFVGFLLILRDMKDIIKESNKYTLSDAAYTFDSIIGESTALQKVINDAKNISKSPSTVLITGESGCGKELLAQAIHNYSDRALETFVAVNCGAIPKSLIESELFGYEEGSFTGSKKGGKPGKFELADGGTIFLDEIGEMPLEMQVHLLRVIQEGVITRIGAKSETKINVRIIAATNKDLKEEIKKGAFRQDLYYRLNVIPLHIPPLKDRFGDVPILIDHFLKVKSEKLHKPVPTISNVLFKKMISYCWPGNIRELENCVENIVNLNGQTSYEMDFEECTCLEFDNLGNPISQECTDNACTICKKEMTPSTPRTLIELEIEAIKNTIVHFNGNMTQAAKSLGISRNALYNKIKRYGIN